MIRRLPALVVIVFAFAIAGCSSEQAAMQSPSSLPPTEAMSAPSSTPSAKPAAAQETCLWSAMRVGVITGSWELVTASRGSADHPERVDSFNDTLKKAIESDEPGCKGAVELAQVNFEAAMLSAAVNLSGEAKDKDYEEVADTGNEWLTTIGRTDYEFLSEYVPNS